MTDRAAARPPGRTPSLTPWSGGDVVRVDPVPRKRRPVTKAGSQDNRAHNRSLILRTLYHGGPMSRADLSRASQLTRPTVSALVADLLRDHLVAEIGTRAEPRVGKPATLVQIDDDAVNIITVDLSREDVAIGAVTNLRGAIVARESLPTQGATGDAAYDMVVALITKLLDRASESILGIGVGAPGIIDDDGVVRFGSYLHWADLPLAERLAEHFGVAVSVGNDMDMAALGVLHFRDTNSADTRATDLIVISVEASVGMGLIVGGKLVEGEHFAAGEVGHLTVDDTGGECRCGRRGCLEVYVGAAHAALRDTTTPPEQVDEALAAAGRAVGVVVAPVATALNLSTVIVRGCADTLTDAFIDAAATTTRARTLPVVNTPVHVVPMADDDDIILLGAASRVLSRELGVL